MKALEKDRTRRYASASDIAADIQRHLTDQPVLAGPPSLAYTAKKFVHRHRGPVAAGLVVLATLVAGLVGTSLMYVSASRANVRAEQQRAGAEQERAEAVRQNYIANLVAADSSLRMNEVPEAKRRLAACDPKLRNWEWRYLSHEVDSSVAVLRDAGNVPVRAWFVPDGSHILGLTDSTHPPEGRRVDLASGPRNVLVKWEPDGRTSATRRDEVAAGGGDRRRRARDRRPARPRNLIRAGCLRPRLGAGTRSSGASQYTTLLYQPTCETRGRVARPQVRLPGYCIQHGRHAPRDR